MWVAETNASGNFNSLVKIFHKILLLLPLENNVTIVLMAINITTNFTVD